MVRLNKIILVLIVCAAALMGCGTNNIRQNTVVMEIAGQEVVREEFEMILKGYISKVTRQYTTDEANGKGFWENEFDGRVPIEQILEFTKEDLTYKKTVASLAKQAGIKQKTAYAELMAEMNSPVSEGEIQYGLTSYEPAEYYSYIYKGVEAELIESLKQEKEVSEEEVRNVYQETIEDYVSAVRVQVLVAEWQDSLGEAMETQIAEAMQSDAAIEDLQKKYPEIYFYELELSTLNNEEGKSGVYYQRWLAAEQMQEGETCDPFSIGDNRMIMRCLSRKENTPSEFEEIKDVLKSEMLTQLAKDDIAKAVEEAETVCDEELLRKIALDMLVPEK